MAHQTVIVVLCGLPGGGKTSLAAGLARGLRTPDAAGPSRREEPDDCRVITVEYDKLLPDDADLSALAWRARRDIVFKAVSNFLLHENASESAKHDTGPPMEAIGEIETMEVIGTGDSEVTGGQLELSDGLGGEASSDTAERCRQLFSDAALNEAGGRRLFIVVDDNMFYRSMRYQYYRLAREARVGFCQVFVHVDEAVARARNSSRAGPVVSSDSFHRVCERMERPDPDAVCWERNTVVVDGKDYDDSLHGALRFLRSTKPRDLVPDPKPDVDELRVAESRRISRENFLHQSDRHLRRVTAEFMKTSSERKRHSAALVKSKAEVLRLLRNPDFAGDSFHLDDVESAFWDRFHKLVRTDGIETTVDV